METVTDFIGFLIILGAIILNLSQMSKRQKPKPIRLEPVDTHPEIQKRIPTGRAQRHLIHDEEELKAPLARELLEEPILPMGQEKRKPLTAKEMMIHYEIFSAPKAFRLK